MQLDQTHVAIRARTLTEIADLAMVMIRCYPSAVILGFATGALPWAILNFVLLGWIPINEYNLLAFDEDMANNLTKYNILMTLLVFLQAPAAGALTTLYLGQAVFESRPTWRSVFHEAKASFFRWFWVLGVLRGPIPVMAIIAINWGNDMDIANDFVWPCSIALVVMLLRGHRPFLPEILLLERCPVIAKKSPIGNLAISARKRSSALHRPVAGELSGRFIAMALLLTVLAWLGLYSFLWVRGILFGVWEWDTFVYLVLLPLALWAAASLSVLIRFLGYLDTRIRLEGWEVQLAVRAEAIRQFGETVDASSSLTNSQRLTPNGNTK